MKNRRKNSSNLAILRVFGGALLLLGLIFGAAWLFNRLDDASFANGQVVEGNH